VAGYSQHIDENSQATPDERNGNPADPRHAQGLLTEKYPWQANSTQAAVGHGPYGPENQLLSDEYWFFEPAGDGSQDPYFDHTPSRRAAPWPKARSGAVPSEQPDDIVPQLVQSAAIHAIDYGASGRMQTTYGEALNDTWEAITEVNSGSSDQVPLPKQAVSSGFMWGTRDRVQSMARQNDYGFDSKHMMRRYATGSIPGNTMWLKPGGRPLVKSLPGPARPPIGIDTPFAGQDLGGAFGINGATLQNVPMEYVAPPQPLLASSTPYVADDSVVEWF